MGRARASTRWGGRRFEGGDRAGGLCSQERAYRCKGRGTKPARRVGVSAAWPWRFASAYTTSTFFLLPPRAGLGGVVLDQS